MNKNTFHLISMGCSKNTVDSDSMAQLLVRDGYHSVDKANRADVLIVNTCGFIGPAKQESLDVLRGLAGGKKKNQILIAAGCLTQRYGAEVAQQVPGLDGILGTRRWMDIVQVVSELRKTKHPEPLYHLPEAKTVGADERDALRATVYGSSAYLKVADGCRRPCAFCAIPLIKGTAVSRPVETILNEARRLRDAGVRELILLAQDTTDYGHDLGMKDGLAVLLERLTTSVPDMDWIRIMYAYPGFVTDRLIDVMASSKQVLPYLDMPLQHGSRNVLKLMKRGGTRESLERLIARVRERVPGITIRTTFITGFPGETDEDFEELMTFVRNCEFDNVGVFTYSDEEGTPAYELDNKVDPRIAKQRRNRLMKEQAKISKRKNRKRIGQRMKVMFEGFSKESDLLFQGRTEGQAQEIDGYILINDMPEGFEPKIGEVYEVLITEALEYDLVGEIVA